MSNKTSLSVLTLIVLLFGLVSGGNAEVIKVSSLKGGKKKFSLKRDIFSPGKYIPNARPVIKPRVPTPEELRKKKEEEEKQRDVVEEIRRSISYEGYVLKKNRNHALLVVNGEFFVAGVEDVVAEKIKVLKIGREMVTVEVESKVVEIQIKEEEENEQKLF